MQLLLFSEGDSSGPWADSLFSDTHTDSSKGGNVWNEKGMTG